MRVAKACLQCRSGKRKCHHQVGKPACDQCIQRNLDCSMAAASITSPNVSSRHDAPILPEPPSQLPLINPTCASPETLHIVELYFRFLHDQPHTLFHEPTFKASVVNGTVSQPVLLGMLGLAARYSNDLDVRSRGLLYGNEAKRALKDDLEHVCIENIQACILVGNFCMADSNADAESVYFAVACRMAQILNLGVRRAGDDGITKEIRLRVYWTCFIVDTWASAGSNLSRQFRQPHRRPRTPMDELTFRNMRPGDPDVPDSEWKPGIWGRMVDMVEIQVRIQDLQRHLADTAVWNEERIEDSIRSLEYEMVAFEQSLAPEMRWSLENLARYINDGLGSVFVAFHIGYQHYCTVLFYIYLDHRRPHSVTNGRTYADRCKYHATMVCDILKASREHEGVQTMYNIVGHVLIVSSSVLLHTYLFGHPDELPEARWRLESNLQSLVLLRGYWPSIELMLNRLITFQNYCIRSLTGHTHLFDRWMVKFLLAHARAMEEKTDEPTPDRMDEPGFSSESIHIERSRVTGQIIMDIRNNV